MRALAKGWRSVAPLCGEIEHHEHTSGAFVMRRAGSSRYYYGRGYCYSRDAAMARAVACANARVALAETWKSAPGVCSKCRGPTTHNETYDAYACSTCDTWAEGACSDRACGYCRDRPDKPSECVATSAALAGTGGA
jgi:hypothetical protein